MANHSLAESRVVNSASNITPPYGIVAVIAQASSATLTTVSRRMAPDSNANREGLLPATADTFPEAGRQSGLDPSFGE